MARRFDGKRGVALAAVCFIVVAALLAVQALGPSSQDGVGGAPATARGVVGSEPAAGSVSETNAVEAGVRFASLMAQLFPLDPAAARLVVNEVASDAYLPALRAAIDAELVPLQRQVAGLAGRPIYRQSVLGATLASYAPPRAEVGAWVMLTAGQAGVDANAMATFTTVTVGLVFERGAWRLDRAIETPGPSPQLGDAPSTVDVLAARLEGFADWRPGA